MFFGDKKEAMFFWQYIYIYELLHSPNNTYISTYCSRACAIMATSVNSRLCFNGSTNATLNRNHAWPGFPRKAPSFVPHFKEREGFNWMASKLQPQGCCTLGMFQSMVSHGLLRYFLLSHAC